MINFIVSVILILTWLWVKTSYDQKVHAALFLHVKLHHSWCLLFDCFPTLLREYIEK